MFYVSFVLSLEAMTGKMLQIPDSSVVRSTLMPVEDIAVFKAAVCGLKCTGWNMKKRREWLLLLCAKEFELTEVFDKKKTQQLLVLEGQCCCSTVRRSEHDNSLTIVIKLLLKAAK